MPTSNVIWKLLDLIAGDWKDSNPSVTELPSLGSLGIHVLHGAFIVPVVTGSKKKNLNNCFSISKRRRADHLRAKDLHELHERISSDYQIICFHENSVEIVGWKIQ